MITIRPEAYIDLLLAIDLCPVEISGLGEIELCGEEKRITEIIIFQQECDLGGTEFDQHAYHCYLETLIREGKEETIKNKRLWWHSHVNMPVFFSLTDRLNIQRFGKLTPQNCNPWLISIVGNKRHKFNVRFDAFWPRRLGGENLPWAMTERRSRAELKELYQERKPRTEALVKDLVTVTHLVEDDDDDDD